MSGGRLLLHPGGGGESQGGARELILPAELLERIREVAEARGELPSRWVERCLSEALTLEELVQDGSCLTGAFFDAEGLTTPEDLASAYENEEATGRLLAGLQRSVQGALDLGLALLGLAGAEGALLRRGQTHLAWVASEASAVSLGLPRVLRGLFLALEAPPEAVETWREQRERRS